MTPKDALPALLLRPRNRLYCWLISPSTPLDVLEELCFFLEIEWEALPLYGGKSAKARAFILVCERCGHTECLYELVIHRYPESLPS